LHERGASRIAYLPADIDRRFALANFPDHGDLLANIVHWAARDTIPLNVTGPGLLNFELYQQDNSRRSILHVVNLTSAGTWRAPVDELIPIGPLMIKLRWSGKTPPGSVRSLVSTQEIKAVTVQNGWLQFEVKSLTDHDVIVAEV
jgi:hypothetical protein